ncbi:MAG: hypothetical protein ACKVTZ_15995 [Bacteroidia bacterium]
MKKLSFFFLLFAALTFSGCLTISENITFKKNGSGTMEYVIDATELMSNFGELMANGTGQENGGGNPLGKDFSTQAKAELLKKVAGVSKVKFEEDPKKGLFKLSFKFKNIKALNDAMHQIIAKGEGTPYTYFEQNGNTFKCNYGKGFGVDMASLTGDDSDEMGEYAEKMNEGIRYKVNLDFGSEVNAVYTKLPSSQNEKEKELAISGKSVKMQANHKVVGEGGSEVFSSTVILK